MKYLYFNKKFMVISSKTQIELYVPIVYGDAENITFKSEITHQEYTFSGKPDYAGDYYVFNIDFSQIEDGEYIYHAGSDKGIIRIGDYNEPSISYTADNKNIQYNAFE